MSEGYIPGGMRVGGLTTFWIPAHFTDLDKVTDGFQRLHLDQFIPKPRTVFAALRTTLGQAFRGKDWSIEPLLAGDGFEVCFIRRGETNNQHVPAVTVKIVEEFEIRQLWHTSPNQKNIEINDLFDANKGQITGDSVTRCLTDILNMLAGKALRPAGGVYWLPEQADPTWMAVAKVLRDASVGRNITRVWVLRHIMDADALEAVSYAIREEINAEAKRLREEILSNKVGEKGIETRRKRAEALRSQVLRFEQTLGISLEDLKTVLSNVTKLQVVATLKAASAPTP